LEKISRKTFVRSVGVAAAGFLINPANSQNDAGRTRAVVFDAFPIFDPRPILKTVNDLFPEKAKQLVDVWQTKQFGYQWIRAAANQYKNFWDVTVEALEFAAQESGVLLSEKNKDSIMSGYDRINIWPDVTENLTAMKKSGLKICFLSNMTEKMLHRGIENGKIESLFDEVISTDKRQTYKPTPGAYQMVIDRLGLKKEEILFVPFAAWDLAGAKWFGYPVFWINRLNARMDRLDAIPDGTGNTLNDLMEFLKVQNNL